MGKFLKGLTDAVSTVNPVIFCLLTVSVIGMNLLANKSVNTGLDWLALDCGILLSWLTFLTMDILTHCYGPHTATVASYLALLINLLMAAVLFVAGHVGGVWGESFVEGSEAIINQALDNTISGTWFIILGSSIAFLVSAVINNFLNDGIGRRIGNDRGFGGFAVRAYVSTFIAQFADNLVFALLVSKVFFGWSLLQCFTCALTGALLELLFEVFFSPMGYRLSRSLLTGRRAAPQAA